MRPASLSAVLLAAGTLAATLTVATPAEAGGVGVLATGGGYAERVWYYDSNDQQYQTRQFVPTFGSGVDLMLGDRDDRIVGIARFYWEANGAEPDLSGSSSLEGVGPHQTPRRDETTHVGVFAVGLQGGIIGDPDKAMLTLNGTVGTGFLTQDHREYVYGEVGAGGTYRLSRGLEAYANVNAHVRFRKWARVGGTGYAGVRVLFD